MAYVDFPSIGVIFGKPYVDFPALSFDFVKPPKLRSTVTVSDMENIESVGQISILKGESYSFLFKSPDLLAGWDFSAALYPEVSGEESIYEWIDTGDAIRPRLSSLDTQGLDSGDYILVGKMSKSEKTEVDIIRLHLGEVG